MKNIKERNKETASKLLDSLYLIEALDDILDGKAKECTILNIIKQNIHIALDEINQCQIMISDID